MVKFPLTQGAIELRQFIDGEHPRDPTAPRDPESVPRFCERLRLPRSQVQRALNGEMVEFKVNFAKQIERATNGIVTVDLWETPPDAPKLPSKERRHPIRRENPAV